MTFSVVALFGILGLAVDLGLAHYVKKSAQAAADAAAMAAASHVLASAGRALVVCGEDVFCQTDPEPCPATMPHNVVNSLDSGCIYANQNGFRTGGKNGRQTVEMRASTVPPPPTAPGVNDIFYWVTVTTSERGPMLFSSVMGGTGAMVSARSTAVVTQSAVDGSIFLLNRQNDTSPMGTGVNVSGGGNPTISAPGGLYLSSSATGAGNLQGTPRVSAPFTYIRGAGTVVLGGSATWEAAPTNGIPDGPAFKDPMAGMGQPPPMPSGGLPAIPVPDGCLSCLTQPLVPGQYYATGNNGSANAGRLIVNGDVTFSNGGTSFGSYVFYGGVDFVSGNANFQPGRYVMAGTAGNNPIVSVATGVNLDDYGPPGEQNSNAGELFIFTDPNYPGLNVPAAVEPVRSRLGFGQIDFQAGNNRDVRLNLHGLNRTSVPQELQNFAPTLFWQDQRNSRVKYDSMGEIDVSSCGGGHNIDNPCTNPALANSNLPGMNLQAHPNVTLYGLIYQPRGAWFTLQGNGNTRSTLMLVTGALNLQGGADIRPPDQRDVLKRRVVALVE